MSQPIHHSQASQRSEPSGEPVLQRVYFASKYGYKPEGVRTLKQRYMEALQALNRLPSFYKYELTYDQEKAYFSFEAADDVVKKILAVLHREANRLIKEEFINDVEGFNEGVLNPESTMIFLLEDGESQEAASGAQGDESFPVDIRLYSSRHIWESKSPKNGMADVITERVQELIMKSTGAELRVDLNNQRILVASNDIDKTATAVKKLENVERSILERVRRDHNVFYTETATDTRIALQIFAAIERLPETTLLEPEPDFEGLEKAYQKLGADQVVTVRCCIRQSRAGTNPGGLKYVLKKAAEFVPVITKDQKKFPSLLWHNFCYAKIGNNWKGPNPKRSSPMSLLRPLICRDNELPRPIVDVAGWTEGLPDANESLATLIDDVEQSRVDQAEGSKTDSIEGTLENLLGRAAPNGRSTRPRDSAKDERAPSATFTPSRYNIPRNPSAVPMNLPALMIGPISRGIRSDENGPSSPMVPPSAGQPVPLFRSSALAPGSGSGPNPAEHLLSIPVTYLSSRLADASSDGQPGFAVDSPENHVPESGGLIDFTECQDPSGQEVASASPTYLDDLAGILPDTTELITGNELDDFFGNPSSDALNNIEKRGEDEPSTRQFHNTMNQKQPSTYSSVHYRGAPAALNPSHETLSSVERGLEPILKQMKSYAGLVTLKAKLGRFMVKGFKKSFLYVPMHNSHIDASKAEELLSRANVHFTSLVTTIPAEAQHILEMSDEKGCKMWKEKPTTWPKVKYILTCREETSGDRFEVEIDGESHSQIVKSQPYTFGVVNVHAAMRNWDYQLIAQGCVGMKAKHKAFAEELMQSMTIPENRKSLDMTMVVSNAHGVDIIGCHVRRECDYESLVGDCVLHIDEVEDMCIMEKHSRSETGKYYWITAHDEQTTLPKTSTRNWIEFSVTSNFADKAFEENITLDIGEQTKWNSQGLVDRGVLWDLCYPMSQIVVQGDGLGFWNEESRPDQEYQRSNDPHNPHKAASDAYLDSADAASDYCAP